MADLKLRLNNLKIARKQTYWNKMAENVKYLKIRKCARPPYWKK